MRQTVEAKLLELFENWMDSDVVARGRNATIVRARVAGLSLEEIAVRHKVSRSRAGQIVDHTLHRYKEVTDKRVLDYTRHGAITPWQDVFTYRFNRWSSAMSAERSHELPIRDIVMGEVSTRAYNILVKLCVYDFAQLCHPHIGTILGSVQNCGASTIKEIMAWRDEAIALTSWAPEQIHARARAYDWSMDDIRWMWK